MVLTLSKSEVSVVGSVSGSFGKPVLLLFIAFFCPPESLSLSWPGALLRPRSTCGSNWAEFGSHGKMRVSEYFLLDNPDSGGCCDMDAVLAVRFGPFLGGKRGQDVGGGIHGCGDSAFAKKLGNK